MYEKTVLQAIKKMISIFSQNIIRFLEDIDKTLNWNFVFMSDQTIEKYVDMARKASRPDVVGLRGLLLYQPIRWFCGNVAYSPLVVVEKNKNHDEDTPSTMIPTTVNGFDYLSLQEATQIGHATDGIYTIGLNRYIKNGNSDFTFEDEQVIMIRMGIMAKVMDQSYLHQLVHGASCKK